MKRGDHVEVQWNQETNLWTVRHPGGTTDAEELVLKDVVFEGPVMRGVVEALNSGCGHRGLTPTPITFQAELGAYYRIVGQQAKLERAELVCLTPRVAFAKLPPTPDGTTVRQYLAWSVAKRRDVLRPRALRQLEASVHLITKTLGDRRLFDVGADDVQELAHELEVLGLRPRVRLCVQRVLRLALDQAADEGRMPPVVWGD